MDEVVVGVLGVPLINTAASSNVKSVVARMPLATASAASSIVWYISKRVGWVSQAIIIIIIITSSSSSSSHHHLPVVRANRKTLTALVDAVTLMIFAKISEVKAVVMAASSTGFFFNSLNKGLSFNERRTSPTPRIPVCMQEGGYG